ncbi:O-antigen ligase family protein [Listeria booriae]|uniref:O-antigen ligase family protein n=1 Tax=Listeria booriae TaxID=1552123 RepID=UPI0021AE2A70|nr:O-antigen ligase family protein [Listeria booriae]
MTLLKETKSFILLFAIFPVMDALNGFVLSAGINLPIGVAYRLICVAFLVFQIARKGFQTNIYTILSVILVFSGIMSLFIQTIVLQNDASALFNDVTNMIKFFLWVLIPYYMYQRADQWRAASYEKIFLVISTFFTFGLLIPYVLGIGNQTYEAAGYKAFFFANNDTTIGFIVSATFTGWYLFKQVKQTKLWTRILLALLYLGNLLGLLLLGTKTGIVYGALLTIVLLIRFFFFQRSVGLVAKWGIGVAVIGILSFILLQGRAFILEAVSGLLQRLIYFYNLYSGDLVRFITSSRSTFLDTAFDTFSGGNLMTLLFGYGFDYRMATWGVGGLVEMDFFDVLFSLGFVGLLVTLGLLIFFFLLACKKRNIYSALFVILIVYGAFAGHVLFSALSSTLFGLVCGGLFLQKESLCEK